MSEVPLYGRDRVLEVEVQGSFVNVDTPSLGWSYAPVPSGLRFLMSEAPLYLESRNTCPALLSRRSTGVPRP